MKSFKARSTKLINGMKVIESPELIKIKTMKKKYLDQILEPSCKHGEKLFNEITDLVFIGNCHQTIIYVKDCQLAKMHIRYMAEFLNEDLGINKEEAYKMLNELPVIFQD